MRKYLLSVALAAIAIFYLVANAAAESRKFMDLPADKCPAFIKLETMLLFMPMGDSTCEGDEQLDLHEEVMKYANNPQCYSAGWYNEETRRFWRDYDTKRRKEIMEDNDACARRKEDRGARAATNDEGDDKGSAKDNKVTNDQGHWFVIAGAWPQTESYKLRSRMALLSSNNIAAKIITTDEYANLSPGLRAVVLGPTSREQAESQLAEVKSIVPDAYIKEGF
jgi:hypothetical protein